MCSNVDISTIITLDLKYLRVVSQLRSLWDLPSRMCNGFEIFMSGPIVIVDLLQCHHNSRYQSFARILQKNYVFYHSRQIIPKQTPILR